MFERFSDEAKVAVVAAQEIARGSGSPVIDSKHLALGTLDTAIVAALFDELGIASTEVSRLLETPQVPSPRPGRIPFTDGVKKALEYSLRHANEFAHASINPAHILLGAVTADQAGPVAHAFELAGVSRQALREVVARLPSIVPTSLPSAELRALLALPDLNPETRPGFERQLVKAAIGEGDLLEARRLGEEFVQQGDPDVARLLVVIGELIGDVNLVLAHAEAALEAIEGTPNAIRGTFGLALAHQGLFDQADREFAKARESEGVARIGVLLECAEAELLAEDVGAATGFYAEIAESEVSRNPFLLDLWLRIGADLDLANGQASSPRITTPGEGTIGRFYANRLEIARIRAEIGRGKPRKAKKRARNLEQTCRRLGFEGVACEALALQAGALKAAGKPRWKATAEDAAQWAERLGRLVTADQIRSDLSGE